MKKIIIIFSFFSLALYINAQPVWQWQNPNPPIANFNSISMIDTTEGWVTVGTNSLMHYNNGQWNLVTIPGYISMEYPSTIFFLSHTCGWVGSNSRINKFNGTSWQPVSGAYNGMVNDLFFFNQNSGWALCGGKMLKINGMNALVDTTLPSLRAFCFPDSLHGWAVGINGTIMSYYNNYWYTWPAITNHNLWDVKFTDLNHGWAVGDSGTVLYFNGTNWQVQNSGVNFNLKTMDFVDATHGYAGGFSDTIIFYNGTSWSFYCTTYDYLLSLDMVTPDRGFASGYTGTIINIFPNYANVHFSSTIITDNELTGVCFKDKDHGWAVGSFGTILTNNLGTWSVLDPPITNTNIWDVHFPDLQHGWAVGNNGLVLNYDHGIWSGESSGTGNYLLGVHFVDSLNGWAVGQTGTVLHYHNGAWISEESNTDFDLNAVFFTDTTNGWAVGEQGIIVHYVNGVWQPYFSGHTAWLNSVSFLTPENGWAVGDSGMIMHYDGINWQINDMMPYANWKFLRSVCFIAPDNGWAVGMQSLYHYDGYSWTDYSYTLPTGYNLNDICFPSEEDGWIVGHTGTILYCNKPSTIQTGFYDYVESASLNEIYPNPCESKCMLIVPNKYHENLIVKLFNVSSQELSLNYQTECTNNNLKIELNTTPLVPGIYFLSIQIGDEKIIRKLVRK